MRRIMTMVATALLLAIPVQAQFCWGIKGGVSLGDHRLPNFTTEGKGLRLDNYAGFFIGPKVEVRIPIVGLGVEGAVMYAQKDMAADFTQNTFQLPLNIKYSFGLGNKANLFLAVGPEFGFNVGKTPDAYIVKKSTLDLNAGLGVTLLKHVQLAANYNMPCGDTVYFKSGIVQFSLAYLF